MKLATPLITLAALSALAGCEAHVVRDDGRSVVVEGRQWTTPASLQTAADTECQKRGLRAFFRSNDNGQYVFDCVRAARPLAR
jgi:putative hemolysin